MIVVDLQRKANGKNPKTKKKRISAHIFE